MKGWSIPMHPDEEDAQEVRKDEHSHRIPSKDSEELQDALCLTPHIEKPHKQCQHHTASPTGNTNEGVKNEAPKELVINTIEQDDSLRNFNFRDIGFDKVGTRHAVILGSETLSALSKEERKKNRSESPIISSDLYGGSLPCS